MMDVNSSNSIQAYEELCFDHCALQCDELAEVVYKCAAGKRQPAQQVLLHSFTAAAAVRLSVCGGM